MRRVALALVAAAVLGACGGSGEAERTTRHDVAASGFSLAVPSPWRTLDAHELLSDEALAEFRGENPTAAPFVEALVRKGSAIRFLAVDPEERSDFTTSLTVVVVRLARAVTFRRWAAAAAAEIRALPNRVDRLAQRIERVPAGDALRLDFRLRLRLGGAERTVATTQYGLVRDGRAFVLTLTTLPELGRSYRNVAAAAARSFRLTR